VVGHGFSSVLDTLVTASINRGAREQER
jgi:hypothetical protein